MRAFRLILRIALAAAVMLPVPGFARIALAMPENSFENRVLVLKLHKSISLDDLIQTAGYGLNDEDVVLFLAQFMERNPLVKSVSSLKKGTLVRVPVRHLKKTADRPAASKEKAGVSSLKQRIGQKRPPTRLADRKVLSIDKAVLLRNIQRLFSGLGEVVSLEKEGFKYISLGDRSDILFDTGLFPVMDLRNDRILVIDYTGAFPDDMKNLLEVYWPEYRVISPQVNGDLRRIVPLLLQESGYLFEESSRMISGGAVQVEYSPDFLVHGKNGQPLAGDISLVSVLDSSEYRTPPEIISWFMRRDIRIIELSDHDRHYVNRNPGTVLALNGNSGGKEFVESVLTLMGYPFSRNQKLNLSIRKEIQFSMHADLLVDMGNKKKIVEFSGVSEQEMRYIKKFGLDIVQIHPWEERHAMMNKIMSLLALKSSNSPQNNAALLTPRNTRYRLLMPGFVAKSLRGAFFMTGANLDEELQNSIIREGISVVHF